MRAFHIIDTAPIRRLGKEYSPEDFDILCQIISAMSWKRKNGEIALVADNVATEALGDIVKIYDKVYTLPDTSEIDNIAFWAGGKIYALAEQNAPCVMLDTDFIVWDKLDFNDCITVAHREEVNNDIYPDKTAFVTDSYEFDDDWDWNELACNTAFAYFSDNEFKNYYTACSKDFMKACKNCDNVLTYMVFAEQRLLAMCAEKKGVRINSLMDYTSLDEDERFTHLWGYKQILRENDDERNNFCHRCINRIKSDFPECLEILKGFSKTKKYL